MKKIFSILLVLSALFLSINCFAEEKNPPKGWGNMQIGLSFPLIGVAKINNDGAITGYYGMNSTIGFSAVNYFHPLKLNALNGYWTWGTLFILIPYFGIGVDYQAENGLFAGIGTIYIIPEVHIGYRF